MPFVNVGGTHLYYRPLGSGVQPVVLVHGFAGTGRLWGAVQRSLPPGYASYAVDLRGSGRSAGTASYALADYVADLRGFVVALGLESVVLVGYSLGGVIAASAAAELGDRVRGLILVAPAPLDGVPAEREGDAADLHRRIVERRGDLEARREDLRRSFRRPVSEALLTQLMEDDNTWNADAYRAVRGVRILDRPAAGRTPTVVVAAEHDRLLPSNRADAARLPRAALHVLPGVGHHLPLEAAAELAALIDGVAGRRRQGAFS
jgi:pimeloyl-ACP methyl ester carboxylesterase